MTRKPNDGDGRFVCSGLVRLHVLREAARGPIFGAAMMDELERHGFHPSAGTLYPLLHALERRGLLTSDVRDVGPASRRVYWATARGQEALAAAAGPIGDLYYELLETRLVAS
jgi:DNA-binding PadR family transcriptional regulator